MVGKEDKGRRGQGKRRDGSEKREEQQGMEKKGKRGILPPRSFLKVGALFKTRNSNRVLQTTR